MPVELAKDMEKRTLKVELAQFSPVWLNRQKTIEKAVQFAEDAASQKCEIVVLGIITVYSIIDSYKFANYSKFETRRKSKQFEFLVCIFGLNFTTN